MFLECRLRSVVSEKNKFGVWNRAVGWIVWRSEDDLVVSDRRTGLIYACTDSRARLTGGGQRGCEGFRTPPSQGGRDLGPRTERRATLNYNITYLVNSVTLASYVRVDLQQLNVILAKARLTLCETFDTFFFFFLHNSVSCIMRSLLLAAIIGADGDRNTAKTFR